MIPDHLLPHDVTIITPAETVDGYGSTVYDYGDAATRQVVRGWVQQDQRSRPVSEGGDPLRARWLFATNATAIDRRARISWDSPTGSIVFELDGPPEPTYSPAGFHHTEIIMRVVDG